MDQFSHDSFDGLSADDAAGGRNDSRDSLFLMAELRLAGSKHGEQVRVRNLSPGGLMADYCGELTQGADVKFDVRGVGWVKGKVAWVAAGRIGVTFPHPIDPLLARRPVGVGPKAPIYTLPVPRR